MKRSIRNHDLRVKSDRETDPYKNIKISKNFHHTPIRSVQLLRPLKLVIIFKHFSRNNRVKGLIFLEDSHAAGVQ